MRVYLDNAATTPIDPEVLDAMIPVMKEDFGNPSSSHALGRKVKAHLEVSRKKIASLLNVTPAEIIFTSGGTEADNMAIRCSVHHLGAKNIITTLSEHHAVLYTAQEMESNGLAKVHYVNLLKNGHVDLNHLSEILDNIEGKSLVSLMHANNEIGNLLDLEKVNEICKKHDALFHSDTVQTMAHYAFDFSKIDLDFAVGAAHKFNGPKGIGFLFHNKKNKLKPLITGGSQERDLRAGTENVYGVVGMAKALEIANRDLEKKTKHISSLKAYFIQQLKKNLPKIKFNGDPEGQSLYTVLSIALPPEVSNEMLLFSFDLNGICISGGSACSSGSNVGSHVMKAVGSNLDCAPIRFSFGKYNTTEEIDFALKYLNTLFENQTA